MESTEHKKKDNGMNKMLMILGGAMVVLVLIGVGFYFMTSNSGEESDQKKVVQQTLRQIEPEDIGFTLTAAPDSQNVFIDVTKPDGIDLIEYELSYDAEGDLPRGTFGEIDIAGGEALPKKVYLGTCSSGTCKPDKGVTLVTVTAKVTYSDGDRAQLESSVNMTE
ncbi:MAG TPA: hypothetical protein PLD54_04690 [Candidatus Levybacteria bacterium]|nr:hypothetical protein [Candidatus Levybacteria bacterium]